MASKRTRNRRGGESYLRGRETIHMPFAVTPESVHAAILTADLLGQQWLALFGG